MKKYDIGSGIIIIDDGHYLRAEWRTGETTSHSIGVKRPRVGPLPEEFEARFSVDGKYFYLEDFTDMYGFWLGVREWDSLDEMKSQQKQGIFGKEYATIIRTDVDRTIHREVLSFTVWNVKDEQKSRKLPLTDMVKDYLSLQQSRDREEEKRFNEAIAFSGRTLKWIMSRIGEWKPEPKPVEPPPMVLN
jgi:hypothetical protein